MKTTIGDIVNKRLNKDYLNNEVFKQIADSEINFISKDTKECLKKYYKGGSLQESKELWRNLLMDSICNLKVNDSREKLSKNSEEDLDAFFASFESIRKENTYGINELAKYFDDFIEFETVLYGTDEHYRDHVEHVLQVWAIGISLIEHHKFSVNDKYNLTYKYDFNFQLENVPERTKTIAKSEFWSMWTIISLCHDLGYPIEKTSKINKQAKKIIAHFGNMNFSELNYSFDIFNTFLVDKYLNIISSKASLSTKTTIVQTKYRDKISKSLEDYRHGVFSGLLLFKSLTFFLETDYSQGESELSDEDLKQFYIRKEILRSIASHTCPKIYHLTLDNLAFLLILCDELQEWNRPNFDDFRKRSIKADPIVELKSFEMSSTQKISIQFTYELEISNDDIKYLVTSKFKHIHNLLRSAKDDNDRKIVFSWTLIFKNESYQLIFNSELNSFKQFSITKKVNGNNDTQTFKLY